MFTGIVERTVTVLDSSETPNGRRLTLANPWPDLQDGQSIAINGCCLTVAKFNADSVTFDVIKETLDKTNLGRLRKNDRVNVERSLKIGDRLDGHFVQGHIDSVAELIQIIASEKETRLKLRCPPDLSPYLIPKGSVALDGVSLTIASVEKNLFEVALIPTTLRLTTLSEKKTGDPLNLETDILSKTVIHALAQQAASAK